jgi:hypothetical protein
VILVWSYIETDGTHIEIDSALVYCSCVSHGHPFQESIMISADYNYKLLSY